MKECPEPRERREKGSLVAAASPSPAFLALESAFDFFTAGEEEPDSGRLFSVAQFAPLVVRGIGLFGGCAWMLVMSCACLEYSS